MDNTSTISNPVSNFLPKTYVSLVIFFLLIVLSTIGYGIYTLGYSSKVNKISSANTVTSTPTTSVTTTPTTQVVKTTDVINTANIPLGDGKVSTSPKVGYIFSCQTTFNGKGAEHAGSWINGDTWNLNIKPQVEGSNSWPNAQYSALLSGNSRILSGNGLPVNSITGNFPISPSDPAYQYDRNPSTVTAQNIYYQVPANPTLSQTPSCVPMGIIGVAENGVSIYNGLDAAGRDAVAHEIQDSCGGHPERTGEYHYHGPSKCVSDEYKPNTLIGYALDGYGIYSMYDANGKEYTNADLDACHGITSPILWDGKVVNMYHYVLTREYPYMVGCFRGSQVIRPNQVH